MCLSGCKHSLESHQDKVNIGQSPYWAIRAKVVKTNAIVDGTLERYQSMFGSKGLLSKA